MTRFKEWTPHGVNPALLLPHRDDFAIDPATYRQHPRDVAAVRPPLVKLPAPEIDRLRRAVVAAGLDREPAKLLAAE